MKKNKLYIYGDIGDWGSPDDVTSLDVIRQLEDMDGPIDVHINSGGGSVTEGFAIYNALNAYKSRGKVTVYIDSLAASIASYIAMVGDTICIAENAQIMIHNPWDIIAGDSRELRSKADQLDRFGGLLVQGYVKRTGNSKEQIQNMLDQETWFTASEAIEHGFADSIVADEYTMAASINPQIFNKFTNVPESIRVQISGDTMNKNVKNELSQEEFEEQLAEVEEEVETVSEEAEELAEEVENLSEEDLTEEDIDEILEAVELAGESIQYARELIGEGVTPAQARARLIDRKAKRSNKPMNRNKARAQVSVSQDSSVKRFEGMKNALLAKAGFAKLEDRNEFKSYRLIDMARATLRDNGVDVRFLDDDAVISKSFTMRNSTTSDFPMLVGSVARVALLNGYEQFPTTHQLWTHQESAPDFRPTNFAGLGNFSELDERAENGEYTRVNVGEFGEPLSLGEYGKDFHLSRRAMINDYAGAFSKIPAQMGAAAKKTVSSKVYSVLASNPVLSDGKAAFHTDRGNIMTGASSALSATSLAAAKKSMLLRVDANGVDVDTTPKYLIVPPSLEEVARALVEQQYVAGQGNIQQTNPHYGLAEVIVERHLEKISDTGWYLIGDCTFGGGFAVAYLHGITEPRLAQDESWSTDALKFKVALDFAGGIVNPLTMLYSKGKA